MTPTQVAARRIKELREPRMTLAEFGERMGKLGHPLSRQTVWKIENGERPLTLDELVAAAYVLETFPLSLLDPHEGALTVGEGVTVDGDALTSWFTCTNHPARELSDEEARALMPPAVREFWAGVQALMAERDGLALVVDRIAASLHALPPEEYESVTSAVTSWRSINA